MEILKKETSYSSCTWAPDQQTEVGAALNGLMQLAAKKDGSIN